MDKKYNIVKAATWYTIGNILIKGVSFFVLPIFTALMSTTDYGIYSVYTSYMTIFETVLLLGLSSTVRIAKFTKDVDFDRYMSTILFIPIFLTIISTVAVNGYFSLNAELLSMNRVLWNYLHVTALTAAMANIIAARLVIEGKYKTYMVYSTMNTLLNVGLALLLCYTIYAKNDVYMARVVGNAVSNIICIVFLMVATKVKLTLKKDYAKIALTWGIPLLFHTLATVVLTQSDRIVIKYMDGYSNAGIYSVAVTIIAIPMVLQSSLESAWSPWFYDRLDKKDYKSIIKMNDKYILLFAVIIAEFILICPEIIHIFTNKNYWDSVYSLAPLSVSVFGEMLYCLPVNVEYYNKKTTYIMTGTVLTVVFNIALDIMFVFMFGYAGAAYATALSKILLFLFHCFFARKIDANKIFSNKVVIGALAGLSIINLLTVLTVNTLVFRIPLFLAIGCVLLFVVCRHKTELIDYMRNR